MPTIIPLTPESVWLESLSAVPDWQPPAVPTLVIAPHPDDETLGAGGLIARLRGAGVAITVAAVTDGENAYADTSDLGRVRVAEQTEALARLGVEEAQIVRLGLPDRNVSLHEDELVDALGRMVTPETHLVAPWPMDFHPDHESAGRAAARVAREHGLPLTYYLFWTWHRGDPSVLAHVPLRKLTLTKEERENKEHALRAHASQLEHADGQPILSDELLLPARRDFEVYIAS